MGKLVPLHTIKACGKYKYSSINPFLTLTNSYLNLWRKMQQHHIYFFVV